LSLKIVPYSDHYKLTVRNYWYLHGKVTATPDLVDMLARDGIKDEFDRIPSTTLILDWKKDMMWLAWADVMDSEALAIVETDIINKKAQMLKEQARIGKELQDLGMGYLKTEGFDSSASAVQAVIRGANMERTSRGIGEMLEKMANMGDEQLKNTILNQLKRASDNDQIIESSEVIDVE
jgi:hypothetical protein